MCGLKLDAEVSGKPVADGALAETAIVGEADGGGVVEVQVEARRK